MRPLLLLGLPQDLQELFVRLWFLRESEFDRVHEMNDTIGFGSCVFACRRVGAEVGRGLDPTSCVCGEPPTVGGLEPRGY